jgi:hypothetical protein
MTCVITQILCLDLCACKYLDIRLKLSLVRISDANGMLAPAHVITGLTCHCIVAYLLLGHTEDFS